MTITGDKLYEVNKKRKEAGRPPLSQSQANAALAQNTRRDDGFDFLIAYSTGLYMPSTGGMMGFAMHHSSPSYSSDSSSSSSRDSYSSSSSSYDSSSYSSSSSSFD